MKQIISIYKEFFTAYGLQGWWPLSGLNKSVGKNDRDWQNYIKVIKGHASDFKKNWPRHLGIAPKNSKEKFEIITGAILTQNTSWNNVERALYNLNKHKINTLSEIKNLDKETLALLIKSAGYHNQKAERLKLIAAYFSERDLDKFFNKPFYELRKELLSLKGIGPETADSILLYAGELSIFVIDSYTKRIFSRILGKKTEKLKDYDDWQKIFMDAFFEEENKVNIFKEYHGLIVRHGKEFCRTNPLCKDCFLKFYCFCGRIEADLRE
ncbi:MAG TPA: hypothetical protein PL110_01430 [Candidatus Eremiobacteraeota bacterium]|nr:hypothetical protein [Candidatus Eremiobacteraeota bacterium]